MQGLYCKCSFAMQNEYLTCNERECLKSVDINGTFYSCSKDFNEHYITVCTLKWLIF